MCLPDINIVTYEWPQKTAVPVAKFADLHKCVDWGALNGWASSRKFDAFKPGAVVHPTLGMFFPLPYNPSSLDSHANFYKGLHIQSIVLIYLIWELAPVPNLR